MGDFAFDTHFVFEDSGSGRMDVVLLLAVVFDSAVKEKRGSIRRIRVNTNEKRK